MATKKAAKQAAKPAGDAGDTQPAPLGDDAGEGGESPAVDIGLDQPAKPVGLLSEVLAAGGGIPIADVAAAFLHAKSALDAAQGKPVQAATEQALSDAAAGVRFTLENPDATPKDVHEDWARRKINDGWGYGAQKSRTDRTHPGLVAYQSLPPGEAVKAALLQGITRGITSWLASKL